MESLNPLKLIIKNEPSGLVISCCEWTRSHAVPIPRTQRMPYKNHLNFFCHPPIPFPCGLEFSPFPLTAFPFHFPQYRTPCGLNRTYQFSCCPQDPSSFHPLYSHWHWPSFPPCLKVTRLYRHAHFPSVFIPSPLQSHSFKAVSQPVGRDYFESQMILLQESPKTVRKHGYLH